MNDYDRRSDRDVIHSSQGDMHVSRPGTRTIEVCTNGQCGECYRCRCKRLVEENIILRKMIVRLYDHGIVTGLYGPWHDGWNEEDDSMWGKIDEWKEEFGIQGKRR